jgi:hypothetical protein
MTRPILVLLAVGAFLAVVAGSGCSAGGVGDPCIPEQEYQTCFPGFQIGEVNVESKSFQCQTRLCLVNHFQGRVSCPYGQTAGSDELSSPPFDMKSPNNCGSGVVGCAEGSTTAGCPPKQYYPGATYPSGSTPTCSIPGGATVLGGNTTLEAEYQVKVAVPPQVFDRNTAEAVYCSCRCANEMGQTNDGSVYCQCPDNYTCTQLVSSIGGNLDNGLVGGYCMKNNTGYQTSQPSTCTVPGTCCNPTSANCGTGGGNSCACP